jgi:hypothetical protein
MLEKAYFPFASVNIVPIPAPLRVMITPGRPTPDKVTVPDTLNVFDLDTAAVKFASAMSVPFTL